MEGHHQIHSGVVTVRVAKLSAKLRCVRTPTATTLEMKEMAQPFFFSFSFLFFFFFLACAKWTK